MLDPFWRCNLVVESRQTTSSSALRSKLGARDGFAAWATEVNEVLAEMEDRYPILADIRDDKVFAKMLSATGVNRDEGQGR
ncbi:hypothetical protein [Mycolicibacterium mageritense]|uniref:Uncharacterized protein n=1 Tax=Mycolicibacterium mageritense TaxID=53462 RepID=A0ABN5YKC5_MYCME|nr:hypothetical protein [Mycolicibacterium mageritense]BBX38533.1 hypothetical protein MMAGJ_78150 [Mycolicibacterium mageritense]